MSNKLIQDWGEFCNGRGDFDAHHFDTLFMTEHDRDELEEIFSHFPNSMELVANVEEFWNIGPKLSAEERQIRITKLAASDIAEKAVIIKMEGELELARLINIAEYQFVDCQLFYDVFRENETVALFMDTLSDHVIYELLPRERNTMALLGILYGLAGSLELRWSIIAPLFKQSDFKFRSFLELWKLGGHYAITENGILLTSTSENSLA